MEGTGELLGTILGEEITSDFLEAIYRETEGNPFFIEEVCKVLIDKGVLRYERGQRRRGAMDEMARSERDLGLPLILVELANPINEGD